MTGLSISQAEYRQMKARDMTEAQLQACVIAAAQRRGWRVYHTHDSRRSQPGFPDLHLVHPGQRRILYRELKTQNGRLRPEQKAYLADLTAAGADAGIWRPIDWFEQRIGDELDTPIDVEALVAVARELGLELLPWQVEYAKRMLRATMPAHVETMTEGHATVRRLLGHVASLEIHDEGRRIE